MKKSASLEFCTLEFCTTDKVQFMGVLAACPDFQNGELHKEKDGWAHGLYAAIQSGAPESVLRIGKCFAHHCSAQTMLVRDKENPSAFILTSPSLTVTLRRGEANGNMLISISKWSQKTVLLKCLMALARTVDSDTYRVIVTDAQHREKEVSLKQVLPRNAA